MVSVTEKTWSGLKAVQLCACGYEALVVPQLGANVISLKYKEKDNLMLDILRTPIDAQTLIDDPYAYGIPVLFPANRIEGGSFTYDGVRYNFPQNYPNGVHIHGVLHNYAWQIYSKGQNENEAWVVLCADTKDPKLKTVFPIDLNIFLECKLSAGGLMQKFTLENKSDKIFPFGLAYHTAFNVPFTENGKAEDVRLSLPIAARCLDDDTNRLPNGKSEKLSAFEAMLASKEGGYPLLEQLDYLYEAVPNTSDAVLKDKKTGYEIVYRADKDDHYWIIWNSDTKTNFVAVEPQTWLSNGIHLDNPEKHGVLFLKPNSSWSKETFIFVK